jgi:N-acetylglutamate synthase-like GNAT family acetyltransferase
MGYDMRDIDKLFFYASVAMSDDDARLQATMFIDCILAFENNIGELHVLDLDGKHVAFCFVLDKFKGERGARHFHLVSVFKNVRGKGFGRRLIEHVLNDINGEPVTLESQPNSRGFFEKVGFVARQEPLPFGLIAMYTNGDGSCDVFYKMENPSAVIEKYLARFDAVAQSLGLD